MPRSTHINLHVKTLLLVRIRRKEKNGASKGISYLSNLWFTDIWSMLFAVSPYLVLRWRHMKQFLATTHKKRPYSYLDIQVNTQPLEISSRIGAFFMHKLSFFRNKLYVRKAETKKNTIYRIRLQVSQDSGLVIRIVLLEEQARISFGHIKELKIIMGRE